MILKVGTGLLMAIIGAPMVLADDDSRLSPVIVAGVLDSAMLPLGIVPQADSPRSIVGREAITQLVSPVGDYGNVLNFTPSYVSSAPNGPGFDAAKNQSLRGFADGQFNVTLDGVPFADPDNFSHHTTSYFPVSMLDHVEVDRSPGGAGDLGYASFGGSVDLYSQALPQQAQASVFSSYGSFATGLIGATAATAAAQQSGDVGLLATVQYTQSNGAMDNTAGHKGDFLVKGESILGDVRLSGLYSYDHYFFYNAGSLTTTDLARYGSSFGFSTDPASPNFYGYSATTRAADFGYLALQSSLPADWAVEDKVYTYSYRNSGLSLKGDQTFSPIGSGFAGITPTDIAGRTTGEDYRTIGNDLRTTHVDAFGRLLVGVWLEHSWETESRSALDLTTGQPYNANRGAKSPVYFAFSSHLDTVQPYAEYTCQVTPQWTVRGGLRYEDVTRRFEAPVIQNFLPGTQGSVSRTLKTFLPSFETRYQFDRHATVYAQVSKGALIPNQSFFYTSAPAAGNQVSTETSLVTQVGVVSQGARYSLGVDAYNIRFGNYVSTIVQNGNTLYVNTGSVRYRGIEAEGHRALSAGFSVVGNASLLRATFQDSGVTSSSQRAGDTIAFAPRYTGLAGVLFTQGPWHASLLAKFVGTTYQGKNGSADGAAFRVGSYSYTNLTAGRDLPGFLWLRNARVDLALDNLWNSSAITDTAGRSIAGPNLVNVLARRNVMLSVTATLAQP